MNPPADVIRDKLQGRGIAALSLRLVEATGIGGGWQLEGVGSPLLWYMCTGMLEDCGFRADHRHDPHLHVPCNCTHWSVNVLDRHGQP